ncbi:MAG: c-type cytochrome biogenesis protein CcsB [Pseudomonadota bacterium]
MNNVCLTLAIVFYLLSTGGYVAYVFRQDRKIHKIASILLWVGFIAQTVLLISRYVETGNVPVHNMHETLLFFAWSIAGVFLFFQLKFELMVLGAFMAPLATLIVCVASMLSREPVPGDPVLKSIWLALHVVTIFMGNAAFAVAFGLAIIYLIQERQIKEKKTGFFYRRFPSLNRVDSMGYASIVVGFSMLTVGFITGAIYAQLIWGRYWSWDPKEVWSLITWLIYAALLHERLVAGWHGRRAAIMAIIGFAALLFTFFGVNFLLKGHHAPFTKF